MIANNTDNGTTTPPETTNVVSVVDNAITPKFTFKIETVQIIKQQQHDDDAPPPSEQSFSIVNGHWDRYSGVNLTIDKPIDNFEELMKNSIQYWIYKKRRGVWIYVHIQCSEYMPILLKQFEFKLHHTDGDLLMLTRWLPETYNPVDTNKIPSYCQHYVGAGGIVIDFKRNQILLCCERHQMRKPPGATDDYHWKVPGGSIDTPDEPIGQGAIREVFEETGVHADFVGIFGFRHMFKFRFGKSDFYFLCLLKAKSRKISMDERELSKCKWFDLEDYYKLAPINHVQSVIRDSVREYFRRSEEERKALLWSTFDVGQNNLTNPAVLYHSVDLPLLSKEHQYASYNEEKDYRYMYSYLGEQKK